MPNDCVELQRLLLTGTFASQHSRCPLPILSRFQANRVNQSFTVSFSQAWPARDPEHTKVLQRLYCRMRCLPLFSRA